MFRLNARNLYWDYLALVASGTFTVAVLAIFAEEVGLSVRATDETVALLGLAAVIPVVPMIRRIEIPNFLSVETGRKDADEAERFARAIGEALQRLATPAEKPESE